MAVLISNNASGRLAGSISTSQTTLSLQSGQGSRFPNPSGGDWFPLTVIRANGDMEIMRCTARSGDVLTVQRGQEQTSPMEFLPGERVELRMTHKALEWSVVPKGGIIMWSGQIDEIPEGWALCNGANGTPDLRGRFVIGAGGSYSVGATGGAESVTLTKAQMPSHNHTTGTAGAHTHGGSTGTAGAHSHTGTTGSNGGHTHTASTGSSGEHTHTGSATSAGAHTHDVSTGQNDTYGSHAPGGYIHHIGISGSSTLTGKILSNGAHTHTLSINSNGAHTHTVSVNSVSDHTHSFTTSDQSAHSHSISSDGGHTHSVGNTGGGNSHENRPPYYALAYIMKL